MPYIPSSSLVPLSDTFRQRISRLVRDSLSFSKKMENHVGAVWYFIHDYNAQQSKGLSRHHYYRITTTALSPVIGYDKASEVAHYALDHDLSLKEAALTLGYVTESDFDRIVDPLKMVHPYVAVQSKT